MAHPKQGDDVNVTGGPGPDHFHKSVQWVSLYPNVFSGVMHTVSGVIDPLVDQQGGVVRIRP